MGEADADTVDAAVGAGKDFEAETVFYDYLAREGDVAGDLGDEAAEGGGFVVLGEREGAGRVVTEVALVVGVGEVEALAEVVGADVAEIILFG